MAMNTASNLILESSVIREKSFLSIAWKRPLGSSQYQLMPRIIMIYVIYLEDNILLTSFALFTEISYSEELPPATIAIVLILVTIIDFQI